MTCTEFRALIDEAVVHETALNAHALECPACAAEERRLRLLRDALAAWDDQPAPHGLAGRALAQCLSNTSTPQHLNTLTPQHPRSGGA